MSCATSCENPGQGTCLFGTGSVYNTSRFCQRLNVENRSGHSWVVTEPGDTFRFVNSWVSYSECVMGSGDRESIGNVERQLQPRCGLMLRPGASSSRGGP